MCELWVVGFASYSIYMLISGSNKLFSSIFKKLSCFSPFPGLPPFILSYYLLLFCSVGIKRNTEKSKLRVEPSCFWVAMLVLICCLIPSNTVHCPCRINIWFKILPTIISQVVRFKWHRHCRVPFYSPSLIFRNFKNWSVFLSRTLVIQNRSVKSFCGIFFFLFKAMGEFNKGTFSDTEETITALNVFYILFGISLMSNCPEWFTGVATLTLGSWFTRHCLVEHILAPVQNPLEN